MKSIYLIRHGKASLEGTDRERGLTEEGIEHAKQITNILKGLTPKISRIYSSPFRRAILTIEPFAQLTGLELKIVEELREKKTGEVSDKNLNEEKRKMWQDFNSKLPGGESSKDATDRALRALDLIKNEMNEGASAAVQSHGTLIGLILHYFDPNFGFEQWKSMTMPDIFQIDFENKKVDVKHIGCKDIETFKING